MGSGVEKSTKLKLWVIFGLFIGLILGLIAYEVNVYIRAKQQRENFESVRKFESLQIKTDMEKKNAQVDSAEADLEKVKE